MDYTVRIVTTDRDDRLVPAYGEVSILREGREDHARIVQEMYESMVQQGQIARDTALDDVPRIVGFQTNDCYKRVFLYEGDHAYVMNASGKTVASI